MCPVHGAGCTRARDGHIMTGTPFDRRRTPLRASHPPLHPSVATLDLSPAVAQTLLTFRDIQEEWANAAVQDAIESVPRIPWWHQVHFGVHVPLQTLYATTVRRLARRAVERFALQGAPRIGRLIHVAPSLLQRLAIETIDRADQPALGTNPRVRRGWTEPEATWRRRFELQIRAELHEHHIGPLVDWVETTCLTIVATWNDRHRTRLVSRRTTR